MGRNKRPDDKPETTTVRVSTNVAEMLVFIAKHRKKEVAEVLTPIVEGPVATEYLAILEELAKVAKPRPKS